YSDSNPRDDFVELANTVRKRCRAGLEDEGRLDFVDMPGSDGGEHVPAGARCDLLLLHGLPAPRRDDDVRLPAHDFVGLNDPVPGELRMTQLRKDRIAPRDFDQFLDPLDARDQRVVPLLEIHARTPGRLRDTRADFLESLFEPRSKRLGAIRAAD